MSGFESGFESGNTVGGAVSEPPTQYPVLANAMPLGLPNNPLSSPVQCTSRTSDVFLNRPSTSSAMNPCRAGRRVRNAVLRVHSAGEIEARANGCAEPG